MPLDGIPKFIDLFDTCIMIVFENIENCFYSIDLAGSYKDGTKIGN